MADQLTALLDAGDEDGAAFAVAIGLALAVFAAVLYLRLFRWVFGLFGVRA